MFQSAIHFNASLPDSRLATFFNSVAKLDRIAMAVLRISLVIVLFWIGGLKFADYEADSIVPFVANSPAMSFLYRYPGEYRAHMNKEGEFKPQNRRWHLENKTYLVSRGLGTIEILIGLAIALYPVKPEVSALGSALLILMACTTLSFLITTPEVWVSSLGDANFGVPYLSGAGRLILKDCIMLGAAFVTFADSAKSYLKRHAFTERR